MGKSDQEELVAVAYEGFGADVGASKTATKLGSLTSISANNQDQEGALGWFWGR